MEVNDFYNENFKPLENKRSRRTLKDGRNIHVRGLVELILFKWHYAQSRLVEFKCKFKFKFKFNAIPIKFLMTFFTKM